MASTALKPLCVSHQQLCGRVLAITTAVITDFIANNVATIDCQGWYMKANMSCPCRWLHPAVFVLLAAFDTLTHEAHAKTVPLQARAKDSAADQPNSKVQHMKRWLSSVWQFHRLS